MITLLAQILIGLVAVAAIIGASLWRRYSIGELLNKSTQLPDSAADSAIISFFSAGHLLATAGKGQIEGLRYTSYVTVPAGNLAAGFVDDIAAISVLDLPFNTETHLIGLSKKHKIDRQRFANFVKANGMEAVVLEGDFPDYFELYAAVGQQVNVREVLAPDAMAYVVDYCRSHFWEINRAELYFVASTTDDGTDTSNIFEESRQFVDQIKPALLPGQPGASVVHHQVSYGEYDGPQLPCPLCGKPMSSNSLWHVCPAGHGVLISGRELQDVRDHTITIVADPTKASPHGTLTCPNCHQPMTPVDYQESGVLIDSCTNCPYRWLDANEISDLASKIV